MFLLVLYASAALLISFLCSIAEAVMLSVTNAHIALLERRGSPSAPLLRKLKKEIHRPLSAILTLNTIAHTVGAVGVGAQVAIVFGNAWVGLASAVLTLLVLVLSEIIPKTLGAHYWRQLAGVTAYSLRWLIRILYPFVILSEKMTRQIAKEPNLRGLNREEFSAMAALSASEGQLEVQESTSLQNLLRLHELCVSDVMTPRSVVFSVEENTGIADFLELQESNQFSRIPLYGDSEDHVNGFVLHSDLLLAHAEGKSGEALKGFRRHIDVILDGTALSKALDEFIRLKAQMMLVVNEYGDVKGIITLEDIFETLLGLEITDEKDVVEDMQKLARKLWKHRARQRGIDFREQDDSSLSDREER